MMRFKFSPEKEKGIYEFRCRDFKKKDIEVYEISDKKFVKRIINSRVEPEITTDAVFQDIFSEDEEKHYLAIEQNRILKPVKIEKYSSETDLRANNNMTDYIIITHEDFYDEAIRFAKYRSSKSSIKVNIVRINEIYDQFSYGLFTPDAIRKFIKYSYFIWKKPSPSYLLVIGDANWDYKDNLGYGVKNFIPAFLVPAHKNEDAASDNWFVCVSGQDILPDLHVGRLAVNTKQEIINIIDKVMAYESDTDDAEWKKRVLFVADDENPIFEKMSDILSDEYLPEDFKAKKLYLGSLNLPKDMPLNEKIHITNNEFSPKVIKEINRGYGFVQFIGHGGIRVWSKKHIINSRMSIDHWDMISNQGKLPIVFTFSCLNGYFDFPGFQTIVERFLNKKNLGAIAVATNTRNSYANENLALNIAIFNSINNGHLNSLGGIITASKIQSILLWGHYNYSMNTFLLFGDPLLNQAIFKDNNPSL